MGPFEVEIERGKRHVAGDRDAAASKDLLISYSKEIKGTVLDPELEIEARKDIHVPSQGYPRVVQCDPGLRCEASGNIMRTDTVTVDIEISRIIECPCDL